MHAVARHYASGNSHEYLKKLTALSQLAEGRKVCSLSSQEFDCLLVAIETLAGYVALGNEQFSLLPKVIGKIEYGKSRTIAYLIEGNVVLSEQEAMEWISSYRLDAVIVHCRNGTMHIRSRPCHCIWRIHMHDELLPPSEGEIDTVVRTVGIEKPGQCIWGFINGVLNTKESALESAGRISSMAGGEEVFSMPNDTALLGLKDALECGVLKVKIDTLVIERAAKFFRYLLSISDSRSPQPPVIVFAHSMGGIICEHALEHLSNTEAVKIRIFTFGGGSFVAAGKSHSDSHNYASAADFVCLLGSPYLRSLAMRRYLGLRDGLTEEQLIRRWAQEDTMLNLDSADSSAIRAYEDQRVEYIKSHLKCIENVTILDSRSGIEHRFSNDCYQNVVKAIIARYQGAVVTDEDIAKNEFALSYV